MDLKSKIILVTDAASFIGPNLIRRLCKGVEDVTVIGINNTNDYYDVRLKEARLSELSAYPSFIFVQGSVADKEPVNKVFGQYRPQVIVNLAIQTGVRYSITNPDVCIESNLIGFHSTPGTCRHSLDNGHTPVEHLVYASSSSVYGSNKKVPYSTGNKMDSPVSPYAATKESNELTAHAYMKLYNIPSTGFKFFTVYGPAGRPDTAYFDFTDRLRAGKTIQVFNYGNCKRDFTYIDDIVTGVEKVMTKAPDKAIGEDGTLVPPYAFYNIENSHPENLPDFVQILSEELARVGVLSEDYGFDIYKELLPMQPRDVPVTYVDTNVLERDLGFEPDTDLRSGLGRFAEWYKEFYM